MLDSGDGGDVVVAVVVVLLVFLPLTASVGQVCISLLVLRPKTRAAAALAAFLFVWNLQIDFCGTDEEEEGVSHFELDWPEAEDDLDGLEGEDEEEAEGKLLEKNE